MMRAVSPLPDGLAADHVRLGTIELDRDLAVPGRLNLGETARAGFWVNGEAAELDAAPAEPGSVRDLARRLRAGGSACTLLRDTRGRIARDDRDVRAWAFVAGPDAEAAADAMDAAGTDPARGPLSAISVGVKDVIDVAGMPTRAGSRQFDHRAPAAVDATAVAALRAAGAIVIGKTTTHEFAFGGTTPPTKNPHDVSRIPGGSSGGSAAAVASGQVRVALGTDTGGSVRIPSAYCGTVGFVPSAGLLGMSGVEPLSWSLDRVGVITGSTDDLALAAFALGLTAQVAAAGPAGVEGLRIGVPRSAFDEPIDAAVAGAVSARLVRLVDLGAVVTTVDIDHGWAAVAAGMTIIVAEAADHHRSRRSATPELFGDDVLATLALAAETTAADYVRAQRLRTLLRGEALLALAGVDLLAMPSMPCVAPRWSEVGEGRVPVGDTEVSMTDAHLRYNILANLAALPCGSVPVGADDRGLPVGMQWIGAPGCDSAVISAMAATAAAGGPADDPHRSST